MARHMSRRNLRRRKQTISAAALGVAGCLFLLGLLIALRTVLG